MADTVPEGEPPIIALVCSVGGLDALTEVLGPLQASFPAAIIVLQHQVPTHPSRLAGILSRGCALKVRDAENNDVSAPGQVLVVPPGRHALMASDGHLMLITSDGVPPYRPSADLLLTSLALSAPKRSIAVILSGAGNDGATGATALHAFGGVVVAATEESSAFFGMPRAAIERDEVVDYVMPVGDIAGLLETLVHPGESAEMAEPEPA